MPRMVSPEGGAPVDVPDADIALFADRGWAVQSGESRAGQVVEQAREDYYTSPGQQVAATAASVARGVTGGGSDVVGSWLGSREYLAGLREHNPLLSTAGEVAGSLLPVGAGGLASRAGRAAGRTAEGAGALAKIRGAAIGGGVEGLIQGGGQMISELALSADPLSAESISAALGNNVLMSGGIGAGVGAAAKAAQLGLSKARKVLAESADNAARAGAIPEDLASLDARGLKSAREAELEAIEATRVPLRQQAADELSAFRRELKEQKVWLATKNSGIAELRDVGARTLKADKALDNLLNDPKALATRPQDALRSLRIQEAALAKVESRADDLRTAFVGDTSGTRAAALDAVGPALERNRGLQSRIADLASAPKSDRLVAIDDARDLLSTGGGKKSVAQQMLGGSVYSGAAGLVGSIPVVGPLLAPFAGAKAAAFVGEKVFGRLAKATGEAATRNRAAIDKLFAVGDKAIGKGAKAAPVIASRVLAAARFAEGPKEAPNGKPSLPAVYKARAEEIRSHVASEPDGTLRVRPASREAIAKRLAPIAAANPVLADKLETIAARRVEFLASKLPKRPELGGIPLGPDRWQPSDMEMRAFARFVSAAEDPGGVIERLAHGSITPEDTETMKAVYPELYADTQKQILVKLPELREALPYQRRVALSIFSGIPVDPAMDPRVLSVLQATFKDEPGSEGGTQAPKPEPAFSAIKTEKPTAAQERAQGA